MLFVSVYVSYLGSLSLCLQIQIYSYKSLIVVALNTFQCGKLVTQYQIVLMDAMSWFVVLTEVTFCIVTVILKFNFKIDIFKFDIKKV